MGTWKQYNFSESLFVISPIASILLASVFNRKVADVTINRRRRKNGMDCGKFQFHESELFNQNSTKKD